MCVAFGTEIDQRDDSPEAERHQEKPRKRRRQVPPTAHGHAEPAQESQTHRAAFARKRSCERGGTADGRQPGCDHDRRDECKEGLVCDQVQTKDFLVEA